MPIEYDNIGAVIASDVKRYLLNNELCTSTEADALCEVYQDQPDTIRDMSWWDVLGLAMKQSSYLHSFWEERAKLRNIYPSSTPRITPQLVSVGEAIKELDDPDRWVVTLKRLVQS